ncbi:MAG: DUF4363 family protein [Thermoclostridium sp.]|nr:DUF4363 family protein [Thermoclostridium sp.]
MKSRTVTAALFGLILVLFIAYFILQSLTFPAGEPLVSQLNDIITFAQQENWSDAEVTFVQLQEAWDRAKHMLALNYAEEDYSMFIDNLSRLQGAIRTRNDMETVNQAQSSLELWKNFIKIIPAP